MILFSVIIPTCNRNDLLQQCLQKLAPGTQTLDPDSYEVIVTDDGKNEAAKLLVESSFSWVTWVKGPRKGPAANRNNGAAFAKGQWLVFTDDDCLPDERFLEEFQLALNSNPTIQVFEGKTICRIGLKTPLQAAPINETGGYLWSCNMTIEKKLFFQLYGFNTNYPFPNMEDVDFRNKLNEAGCTFVFVPKAIVDHPPRKVIFGNKLAKQHESNFYYNKVVKRKDAVGFNLIKEIFINRTTNILKFRISMDSIKAIVSLFVELFCTFLYLPSWYKKYSHK